jgi:hypothetical protein
MVRMSMVLGMARQPARVAASAILPRDAVLHTTVFILNVITNDSYELKPLFLRLVFSRCLPCIQESRLCNHQGGLGEASGQ